MQDAVLIYRLSEGGANERVNVRAQDYYCYDIELSSS